MNHVLHKAILIMVMSFLIEGAMGHSQCRAQSKKRTITLCSPTIEFTYIPTYGTTENLAGRVHCVNPDSHKVAVYIFIEGSGWWTKPYFASPLTVINSDSTWTCDVTTGGNDIYATGFAAFLLRDGIAPPQAGGSAVLPDALDTLAVASVVTTRPSRQILFSGLNWWVKTSLLPVGPGPNYFSDSEDNVWVDSLDQLHLRITQHDGHWYCPEVISQSSFGYGKYVFQVTGGIGRLDRNVVLGIFTWDNANTYNHREIDIEFSRWGVEGDSNAQYVIQPYTNPGNRYRWMIPESVDSSTHIFDWVQDSVYFMSVNGYQYLPPYDSIIHTWYYTGPDVPDPGNENVRLNLWLLNGIPPSDSNEVEVIIREFKFTTPIDVRDNGHYNHIPSKVLLYQNYPNPFNPSTTIEFTVTHSSVVTIKIYNILGHEVRTLLSGIQQAGKYEVVWDSKDNAGKPAASGIYLYRLEAGGMVKSRKCLLIK